MVAHDTGSVHNIMTKAEQKRWSTLTNSLASLTFVKKFYENTHILFVGIGNTLQLEVYIFNDEYNPLELMKDLEDLVEEEAKAYYEPFASSHAHKITVKWELMPYDNEVHELSK